MPNRRRQHTEFVELGQVPRLEPAALPGEPRYRERARRNCEAFIQAIRSYLGAEPAGAKLDFRAFAGDDGVVYTVVCEFDPAVPQAVAYARACERTAPATWAEGRAGPQAVPVTPRRSRKGGSHAGRVTRERFAAAPGNPPPSTNGLPPIRLAASSSSILLGRASPYASILTAACWAIEEGQEPAYRVLDLIRQHLGGEPEGAELAVTAIQSDGRMGYDITCSYDRDLPGSMEYAFRCQRRIPQLLAELAVVPPAQAGKDAQRR
jgi:hypothetical protein